MFYQRKKAFKKGDWPLDVRNNMYGFNEPSYGFVKSNVSTLCMPTEETKTKHWTCMFAKRMFRAEGSACTGSHGTC